MVKVASLAHVRHQNQELHSFKNELIDLLNKIPSDTDFCVLPEYCWGDTTHQEILEIIFELKKLNLDMCLILGSAAFTLEDNQIRNYAIIVSPNQEIQYVPKTNILDGEKERQHVISGLNNDVFSFKGIIFAVMICADLWNHSIMKKLVIDQSAQLLLIPALTVVPPGLGNYAKVQWYSLGITRSREFLIPLVIADHHENTREFDVGKVTCVIDPSFKRPEMKVMEDFLITSKNKLVIADLDFEKINEYRDYRISRGLFKP